MRRLGHRPDGAGRVHQRLGGLPRRLRGRLHPGLLHPARRPLDAADAEAATSDAGAPYRERGPPPAGADAPARPRLMDDLGIREETPGDFAAVHHLNQEAFGPGSPEAGLVESLRDAGAHVPALCLVAEQRSQVVGHIFLSEATLESGDAVLALAPMAVLPARQRAGIGSALVRS